MDEDVIWGRLNQDDVVVDRESSRNANMAKQKLYTACTSIAKMRKKYDSVVKVLDRGIELFPNDKFPYDHLWWLGLIFIINQVLLKKPMIW